MQLQQPLIIIVILVLQPGPSLVCPSFSSPLHSFRCLFLYLLISSGLHLLGFLDKIYFTGWGSHPNAQPQTCRSGLCIYSVILSVLDPRECEYLKDYSLDFEHAYMTTYLASWEACRYLFAALWNPDVIGTTTGVWRHVAHSRIIGPIFFHETLITARYLKIFKEFVDQLDDDELRNGYFE